MENLKSKINADYLVAFKDKEKKAAKSALSMLKAKITESEKAKGNIELNDDDVMKVILSSIKQRRDSIEQYTKAGRSDLADPEKEELAALEVYLPAQMSEKEMSQAALEILDGLKEITDSNRKIGMATGQFNKKYAGQFDNSKLRKAIEDALVYSSLSKGE